MPFVKQQCLRAIGLLHTQLRKVSAEHASVHARARAADAESMAENYANVARAAELRRDVDALRDQLATVVKTYGEHKLDTAELPASPARDTASDTASVRGMTEALERTQQHIGAALVAGAELDALEQQYEVQQHTLLGMISKDVTETADAYAVAQAAALAAPGRCLAVCQLRVLSVMAPSHNHLATLRASVYAMNSTYFALASVCPLPILLHTCAHNRSYLGRTRWRGSNEAPARSNGRDSWG